MVMGNFYIASIVESEKGKGWVFCFWASFSGNLNLVAGD